MQERQVGIKTDMHMERQTDGLLDTGGQDRHIDRQTLTGAQELETRSRTFC